MVCHCLIDALDIFSNTYFDVAVLNSILEAIKHLLINEDTKEYMILAMYVNRPRLASLEPLVKKSQTTFAAVAR